MTKENRSRPSSKKRGKHDADAPPGLPPRPYTDYTIFYRMERAYLLQSSGNIDEETIACIDPSHDDPVEHPRPPKYQLLVLPPYWYSSTRKAKASAKRKHRKREGRMDLATLSRTISTSWKEAAVEIKEYCRKLAVADHEFYKETLKEAAVAADARQASGEAAKDDIAIVPNGAPSLKIPLSPQKQIDLVPSASSLAHALFAERRRFSAPPEFMGMGPIATLSSCGPFNGGSSSPGHGHPTSGRDDCDPEPARQTKRRLTTAMPSCVTARGLQELAQIRQTAKFEGGGPFTRVPSWKKEDVNILLDMLDVPRVNHDPVWVQIGGILRPDDEGVAGSSLQHLHPASFGGAAVGICGLCLEK